MHVPLGGGRPSSLHTLLRPLLRCRNEPSRLTGPRGAEDHGHRKAENPEAQGGYVSRLTSHSEQGAELGLGSGILDPPRK